MILNYFHELNNLNETWELEEIFETHDELNQQLFDNDILRKAIRERLLEIVDLFVSKIKEDNIPINVIDYWLLGSNAAYNYGPKSDIDIHIIVNLEDLGVDPYILQVLYDYIKSDFNNKYDIMVKGHEVELYLEDVRSGAVTNGIYSLKQNRWIKFPTRTEYMRFDVIETDEYKDWYQRYLNLKDDEIEQFINDLYLMRKESLATEGEWGIGNLVFKEFRNLGYLDSLKDRKYQYRSKELTLEGLNEASNAARAAFGDTKDRNSNNSGQKLSVKSLENLPGKKNLYVGHHIDGKHEGKADVIIPTTLHNKIHNEVINRLEKLYFNNENSSKENLELFTIKSKIKTQLELLDKLGVKTSPLYNLLNSTIKVDNNITITATKKEEICKEVFVDMVKKWNKPNFIKPLNPEAERFLDSVGIEHIPYRKSKFD